MRNEKKWYFFFVIDFRAFKHHLDLVTKPLSDRKTTLTECCTGVMPRACHSLSLWRISMLKRTKRKKNAGLKFKGAWVHCRSRDQVLQRAYTPSYPSRPASALNIPSCKSPGMKVTAEAPLWATRVPLHTCRSSCSILKSCDCTPWGCLVVLMLFTLTASPRIALRLMTLLRKVPGCEASNEWIFRNEWNFKLLFN